MDTIIPSPPSVCVCVCVSLVTHATSVELFVDLKLRITAPLPTPLLQWLASNGRQIASAPKCAIPREICILSGHGKLQRPQKIASSTCKLYLLQLVLCCLHAVT